MEAVTLARWQFAITTVYHFLFVPITIGLSGLVAIMQTIWARRGDDRWLRLTKFFGKLFMINFAMGVVTGIVQEFQFGMNWSEYSRFVGDIFGAPLAMEGLLAFFLESTFLGLWIFGWGRLPRLVHLACIWIVALGSALSATFILAANSWMQNPVGFTYNAARGRAELTDFGAVLTNPVALVTLPHQILACYMVAGAFLAGVAGWHLHRLRRTVPKGQEERLDTDEDTRTEIRTWRGGLRVGAVALLIAGLGVAVSGDVQGKIMTDVQPMKMAAAEALYRTEQPASFSVLTIGTLDGRHEVWSIKVPYLLSFLATGDPTAEVEGVYALQQAYEATYGPGSYAPNIPLAYWTFRLMIGTGVAAAAFGAVMLWLTRGNRLPPRAGWWRWAMVAMPLLPLAANSFGWIFTETGRQPWLVFGLMRTADGVSPGTTVAEVAASMSAFTVVYGGLAIVEARLLFSYIGKGLPNEPSVTDEPEQDAPLTFAY